MMVCSHVYKMFWYNILDVQVDGIDMQIIRNPVVCDTSKSNPYRQ